MKTRKWTNKILDNRNIDTTSDYLWLFPKWITKEERNKYFIWDIFINWAVCLKCWEFIRSKNKHDFKMCKCWAIWVDWGSHYIRRIWEEKDYINVIENFN